MSDTLSDELITRIDKDIRSIKDPGLRFGMGIRLWMRWAEGNPQWCRFIARAWNSVKYERPFQDIREGIRKKVFAVPDAYVAWDVLSGLVGRRLGRHRCVARSRIPGAACRCPGVPQVEDPVSMRARPRPTKRFR
jgi:hypothetical protein